MNRKEDTFGDRISGDHCRYYEEHSGAKEKLHIMTTALVDGRREVRSCSERCGRTSLRPWARGSYTHEGRSFKLESGTACINAVAGCRGDKRSFLRYCNVIEPRGEGRAAELVEHPMRSV